MELLRRPYAPSDAQALTDLVNIIEADAGGHAGFTVDDTTSLMSALIPDLARDTRLVIAPDGMLVGAAATTTPPKGGFRIDLFGGVHPQWRGRGIGRELLGRQLARAAEIHAAEAPDADWEVHAGAVLGDHEAIRLYERYGMTPVRYWFEMAAPTLDAPALTLPEGMCGQTYTPAYETALYAAHCESFRDHWGYQERSFEAWTTLSVRSESFLPELSRLAFDGDELAGYVLSYSDADPKRTYIGQVGVRRPWRRRGLAGALLAEVLMASHGAGFTTASLGVDSESPTGAVGVYERVGFRTEYQAVTYRSWLGTEVPI